MGSVNGVQDTYDYVIVGGGTAGCVLATRLKQGNESLRVLLIEAGLDEHQNPQVLQPLATASLPNTPLLWNYKSVPQKHLNGRCIDLFAGKMLSGSSGANYALWTRCHSADWDLWAEITDDDGWSYEKMLPYFCKTENYHDIQTGPEQHGFQGPIFTQAGRTNYPLRDATYKMWSHIGVPVNDDANNGNPFGLARYTENWHDGVRQPSGLAYGLSGVDIMTQALVHRLIIDEATEAKTAKGVEVDGGRRIFASKEVIVCCGAMRSPQLLILSGIGPANDLSRLGIRVVLDNTHVGTNFHDHPVMPQFWKLKPSYHGQAFGSPTFDDNPEHTKGLPIEWLITASVPEKERQTASLEDQKAHQDLHDKSRNDGPRADIEMLLNYAPLAAAPGFEVKFDGTYVSTACLGLLPTSRGTITLNSTNVEDMPQLDPNYCATKVDMLAMRHAMRLTLRAVESPQGKLVIDREVVPEGWSPLTSASPDDELDARIRACVRTWYHPAGTLAMGTVVDSHCHVKGIDKLRVVDASIFPTPLSGHYQAPVYAIAERVADLILASQ